MIHITKRKLLRYVLLPNIIVFTVLAIYFPGSQFPIALTLATGIHRSALQDKIDACEAKAIEGGDFNEVEINFLRNLYTCLYKGARLTVIRSNLANAFVATYSLRMRGDCLRFQAQYLRRIRIPDWSEVAETMRDPCAQPPIRTTRIISTRPCARFMASTKPHGWP